jgi:polyisoprenoid-binding protein YceI
MSSTAVSIPGYVAGTWNSDQTHSEVSFVVRHMMVSKVRGKFTDFTATIVTGEDASQSSVTAEIVLNSIDTGNEQRDGHLRSADFFEVDAHEKMTYRSTAVTADGDDWRVEGELSLHGVTRPVPLKLEVNGFTGDPYGGTRAGFTATGEISRSDFGIEFNMPMDGGGVVVGDKIQIQIEIEAVLATA